MKMVLQIVKAELRSLFYSPVAWFLLIVFIVQCAWFYTTPLHNFANWQDIRIRNTPGFKAWNNEGFTRELFVGKDGFFKHVLQNLYLFIPLLTMGLIGREVQSGTIKLLYSSPVSIRQIVLGKYLAMMFYGLVLVVVVGVFFVTAAFNIKSVDYGMLFSAALGFYLLTCAYAAIGTFMSSLSTYQVITALGTFVVIFILTVIGNLWQQYDFIRDLTYFLFLSGRTEKMLKGLITSKDVIYFAVVIGMFLLFTMLRLRAARELKPWYIKAARYVGVVAATLLVGYISSRPVMTFYWDTTQQKVNTIHPKTQQLVKAMGDEPLEVTLYTNLLGRTEHAGLPENRNAYLSDLWEKYLRFKPDINFRYEYYYDFDSATMLGNLPYNSKGKTVEQIARKKAEHREIDFSLFEKPEEMRKKIDLREEGLNLVMQLKYKGRTEFLRTYNDNEVWPLENAVAAVIKKLLYPEKIPRVYFITGHYERSIHKRGEREYGGHTSAKTVRIALVNKGFEVDSISLENNDIPANTDLLVLADPKSELSAVCRAKISDYISKGGNMFILGEPGKQSMVNSVLRHLGVRLTDGVVVMASRHQAPDFIASFGSRAFGGLMKDPSSPQLGPASGDASYGTPGTTAIEALDSSDFTITTLFKAKSGAWLKKGVLVPDSAQVVFNAAEGDLRSLPAIDTPKEVNAPDSSRSHGGNQGHGKPEFSTIAALHRFVGNKDQRIVVAADADCMSNKFSMQVSKYGDYFYSWLTYGNFPVYLEYKRAPDRLLTINAKTAKVLGIVYVYVLPAILLVLAAILLIRRKRK